MIKILINENINSVKYKISEDEDRVMISAMLNNIVVGKITMEILFDSYEYEFEDVLDEDEFYSLYPDNIIVKIEHLEIEDKYKNKGLGFKLMNYAMDYMKSQNYNQFYLNASPMGFSGLNTNNLVNFYKKFGFKVLLNQGHNVLMGVTF